MMEDEFADSLGEPAPYSPTTPSETRSRDIFHSLLDRTFVQGELRVQDKIPNVDGTLELTDKKLHPIGKIEVQLKTLDSRYYDSPKYSCDSQFIAYCYKSPIPVLLVLVDQKHKCAYWRHINLDAAHEFRSKLTGRTYSLPVPKENCLNGESQSYVASWTKIVQDIQRKILGFDSLQKENDKLLKKIDGLLHNPTELPVQNLKELYNFLDLYNHILDREFPSIKRILYPEYWKIGIGVISYELEWLHFLLFPVEYTSSRTLVKSISKEEYKELEADMLRNNILLIATNESSSVIKDTPTNYAYNLLSRNILDHVAKNDLFVPDQFVANEYLINFLDKFSVYLGLPVGAGTYDIADLDFRLNRLIPMVEGRKRGYADWVTEYEHCIDSDAKLTVSSSHTKAIHDALKDLEAGVVPKVKITLYCKTFNLDTISAYMKWLVQQGSPEVCRVYEQGQVYTGIRSVDRWKTWNIDVLWSNLQVYFKNFFDVYDLYLETHFPLVAKHLRFFKNVRFSIACVMRVSPEGRHKPHLELYFLIPPTALEARKVFCFKSVDQNLPFDRAQQRVDNHCTIEGNNFEVVEMWARPLDFMFAYSPIYEFLKLNLVERLKHFFAEMSKIKY